MSESEDSNEISFTVKFLGRVEVIHPSGVHVLNEAVQSLKFLLHSCQLSSISFCAVIPSSPKVFGFVSQHPAEDMYHCYLFQSNKFSHVLVSLIGDAFRATKSVTNVRGARDLKVEALRHKNKMLQRQNEELRKRFTAPSTA